MTEHRQEVERRERKESGREGQTPAPGPLSGLQAPRLRPSAPHPGGSHPAGKGGSWRLLTGPGGRARGAASKAIPGQRGAHLVSEGSAGPWQEACPQEHYYCALKDGGLGWAGGNVAERSRQRRNQNSPGRCLLL